MSEPFLGQIQIFPYNFAPRGWAFCDGLLLPISQNTALFSLIGTIYGGDGENTFAPGSEADSQLVGASTTIGNTGSSQSFDNMPPFLSLNFCIALVGIFPSRS